MNGRASGDAGYDELVCILHIVACSVDLLRPSGRVTQGFPSLAMTNHRRWTPNLRLPWRRADIHQRDWRSNSVTPCAYRGGRCG